MKRMLINATQQEELRMAMVDGQRLYDLNIEGPASERKKANIYKGKITRIEPSLEAAFVDYGAERHGFLPLKEISSEYFVKQSEGKPNIKDVLREGQDIVVQIDKEERGNKGAALTTFVSLAGRFIVLKPNKARSGGVSRRIVGADRDLARKSLNEIDVPDGMSVILRTAGIDRSGEELGWDLENLLAVWHAILNVVLERPSPFLIYRESNAVVRALRDYLTNEVGEILVDDEDTYKEAHEFVEQVMPHNLRKLKHYVDDVPLFTRYQIETQIESAFAHDVSLPSGGSIVIDHTEALVSIDINSARATKGGDIEATALNTNLEAAEEIARQLRLRDLGGLVVIDFIDMGPQKNQRAVENKLRESVRQDRARVQIGKITRFGLLEMSRQRLRPSLGESSYHTCPRCSGIGTIRSVESLALAILRIIGEEARKERTAKVIAQLPVEVATYLLNEKRDWVQSLETTNDTQVVLVANSALETPHYDIRRVRDDQVELPENAGASYELAEAETEAEVPQSMEERKVAEKAAVGKIAPASPAPERKKPEVQKGPGFFARLMAFFTGGDDKKKKSKKKTRKNQRNRNQQRNKQQGRRRNERRGEKQSEARKEGGQRSRRQRGRNKQRQDARNRQDGKPAQDKRQDSKAPQDKRQDKQAQGPQETQDGKPKRPSRNRRSRGGRRRRQEADSQNAQEKQNNRQAPAAKSDATNEGPPKVRTDAERAADKARENQAAAGSNGQQEAPVKESSPAPAVESAPKHDSAPKQEAAPPKDTAAKQEATGKPETPPAQEAAPKQDAAPKQESAPKPESAPQPSDNGSGKPDGRLLPWEPPAPSKPAESRAEPPAENKPAD